MATDRTLRANTKVGDTYLRFHGITYHKPVKVLRLTPARIYFDDGGCISLDNGKTIRTSEGPKSSHYLPQTEERLAKIANQEYRMIDDP